MGVGAVTVAESLEGGDGLGVEKRWGRGVAQFIECSFQQTTVALVIRLVSVGLGQFEVEERQETEKVALYVLLRGEVPHTHASLAGWSWTYDDQVEPLLGHHHYWMGSNGLP